MIAVLHQPEWSGICYDVCENVAERFIATKNTLPSKQNDYVLRKKTPGDFGDMQYQQVPATKWFRHILNFRGRNVKDILQ